LFSMRTGLDKQQIIGWFINARKRYWQVVQKEAQDASFGSEANRIEFMQKRILEYSLFRNMATTDEFRHLFDDDDPLTRQAELSTSVKPLTRFVDPSVKGGPGKDAHLSTKRRRPNF
jgi:hypothetical protein